MLAQRPVDADLVTHHVGAELAVGEIDAGQRTVVTDDFATRIRLADSQTVTAIAEMSDGSLWSDSVEVIVTIAACLEYN